MKVIFLKNIVIAALAGCLAIASTPVFAGKETVVKAPADKVASGYIVHKIPLQHYAKPQIQLKNLVFEPVNMLPDNAFPTSPENFDILLGKERKQPFAIIRIPVFSYNSSGAGLQRLAQVTIDVTEHAPAIQFNNRSLAKSTGTPHSPLATGTWYKLAVSNTGLHKITHDFVASRLGVSNVPSSKIRICGHGGRMLPEANSIEGVKGLTENAIWVNDGGDGTFGPGDYIVFYAQGPLNWHPSADGKRLVQEKNLYEDKGYYFINFEGTSPKRVTTQQNAPSATVTVNTFTGTALHEVDAANPQKFGKKWWGEEFSNAPGKQNSYTFNLDLGNVIDSAEFRVQVVNTSEAPGLFNIVLNGQQFGSAEIGATNNYEYAPRALGEEVVKRMPYTSSSAVFRIDYNTATNDGSGWLDYIAVNTRRLLSMDGNTLLFSDLQSVGPGNVAAYNLANANGGIQVWDVTDPQNPVIMTGSLNGNIYSFTQNADKLHWFAAMNNASLPEPEFIGVTPNQNLFGSGQVDYVIVTYPGFKPAAERLADFHRQRSGMKVMVATTTQVYNEFSSGGQDISAIRDLMRMFYDRAGMNPADMPRYLLLLGDASYDYKDRIKNNTNFVPTFEAEESFQFLSTYSNDDFYGFLDDNEDIERYDIANTLDIGIGRIPAKSLQEAEDVVNKIFHYKSPATLGPWRLSTMFVADNEDAAGNHLSDAEIMASTVDKNSQIHNATKVYEDAIPMISTPGGQRAPEANKAINDGIFKGIFLFNYSGHGNTSVLSHERILTADDYNKWRNLDKMPFMVTATCDFGQFDQPSFVSAGEAIFLKRDGGVIATLTTTHLVYAFANEILNREFLNAQFQHINGRWNTFGDAMRIGKNSAYSGTDAETIKNFRKFALLGDPALEPNFPEYFIHTESVKDGVTGQLTNTISALGEYVISGNVADVNGNILSDFNGTLAVTIFDKPRTVRTITKVNKTFEVQNNTIYKGKATVSNGRFSFSFIAPKDINYELGDGTISFYADNGVTDAAGRDSSVQVGGYSDNPRIENNPPVVRAFIKDSLFRNGGLTGSNTALFAIIEDETGINVSGNAVGHDLTAVLDGDVSKPYIMNDYYETAPNTFKRGYVYFPVEGIPEGRHRLTVKAWDVNNNSGEGYVDFEVADGKVVKVQNLMNYPNPFRDVTHFVFEHNHPDEDLTAEINIYTTSGVFVRKLTQDFISTGSRSNEITWDATDNNGVKLPAGIYIYRMKISTPARGVETTAYQKLVLVR